MSGAEVAAHFSAKKIGKLKWKAHCTAHPDKSPSLYISEGKKGVMLVCWSNHCTVADICKGAGLTVEQLFFDSGRKLTPQQRVEARKKQRAAERAEESKRKRITYLADMVRKHERLEMQARNALIADLGNEKTGERWHNALDTARIWGEHFNKAINGKDRTEVCT